ncbi:ankyrin [Mytilinidion resinicola]|uniref:Ankyrin n=1 Tax=Mytilinidion resinicola TaxID=574789 RepID=A0A6A6YUC0_9PEZI|nr:ankyrin [Mytilinidion resinicola]KAF2812119.1 ankyrin [Mytilinidion resinicola]
MKNRYDVVEMLLNQGAEPNAQDINGGTALHRTIWEGDNHMIVCVLCDKGANVNGTDTEGRAPLFVAALQGNTRCVKALLDRGADVHLFKKDPKWSKCAIHIAARKGHDEIIRLLVKAGADVEVPDPIEGWTPLHEASYGGTPKRARL